MPIRPELRHFYGVIWRTITRPAILRRAGGLFDADGRYLGGARCERCGKPDREIVFTYSAAGKFPWMVWTSSDVSHKRMLWRNQWGGKLGVAPWQLGARGLPRRVSVLLGVAHLNHQAGDDRPDNLAALCEWCHLHIDAPQHHETRAMRKDAARPLLTMEGRG